MLGWPYTHKRRSTLVPHQLLRDAVSNVRIKGTRARARPRHPAHARARTRAYSHKRCARRARTRAPPRAVAMAEEKDSAAVIEDARVTWLETRVATIFRNVKPDKFVKCFRSEENMYVACARVRPCGSCVDSCGARAHVSA